MSHKKKVEQVKKSMADGAMVCTDDCHDDTTVDDMCPSCQSYILLDAYDNLKRKLKKTKKKMKKAKVCDCGRALARGMCGICDNDE